MEGVGIACLATLLGWGLFEALDGTVQWWRRKRANRIRRRNGV